jgi:hypothetical protein
MSGNKKSKSKGQANGEREAKRSRASNFTSAEVDALIVSAFLRKKSLGYGTSNEKRAALLEVTMAVNQIGGNSRTPEQCSERIRRDQMRVKAKGKALTMILGRGGMTEFSYDRIAIF